MKAKVLFAIGMGLGTVAYQVIRHGWVGADYFRGVFVAAFTALVVLLLPARWFVQKRPEK